MATLFSATLDLAEILGNVIRSTATGGTTATLIDTGFPRNPPPDDAYNYGTLFLISCTQTALNSTTAVVTD